MLYNADQLVTKVRRHLVDKSGQQQGNTWTDDDILAYINEEQEGLIADTIEAGEDWFGVNKDVTLVAGQGEYDLFDGFLILRLLEFQGSSSSANPDYSHAIESRMIEGVMGSGGIASQTEAQFYYALYGDKFAIEPQPSVNGLNQGRMWFIREPGPVLLEIPSALPAADEITLTLGEAPFEDDIMIGTMLDVVAGAGLGQRRKFTAWAGVTRTGTLNSPFSPVLDSTSKIATISRVPRLFHRLLHRGAALRAKVDENEDMSGLAALYNEMHEKFINFIEDRTGGQRSVVPFDPDDGI